MWEGQKFNRLRQFGLDKKQKSTVQGLILHWSDCNGQGDLIGLFHLGLSGGDICTRTGSLFHQGSSASPARDITIARCGKHCAPDWEANGFWVRKEQEQFSRNKDHISCKPPQWSETGEVKGQMQKPRTCNTGRAIATPEIQIDHTSHLLLITRWYKAGIYPSKILSLD